tara:strand:- start:95 stop:1645 length:1551 start_codon:yes stop_codon:yes gene_type:complete
MKKTITDHFKHKIKSITEIIKITGKFPRKKKLILCHGVFDIVHPGHLRHLVYAKSKADYLVVSVTSDKYIDKGIYRPHVPEDLRVANLAAFEIVDFAYVDDNKTPLNSIEKLKPDLFAKGYEYTSGSINTNNELKIINKYGGETLYTPGDIVFSSSKILESKLPKLKYEKLLNYLESANLEIEDLKNTLQNFKNKKIHVVGDTIVDSLTECSMLGGQSKTPTMSVKYENKIDFVGGAGIVAKHLASAGASVNFTTVLGDDELRKFVVDDISKTKVNINVVKDISRPTTNKNAILVDNYRLLKIDTLENNSINEKILARIINNIKNIKAEAVIFSDFRHGIFNSNTIKYLSESISKNVFKVADSQVASRWGNILDFKRFDLITPNEKEARFSLGDQDTGVRPLAAKLIEKSKCKNIIFKMGERGLLASSSNKLSNLDNFFSLESFTDNAIDPVGSGDALLAYSTLSILESGSIVIAAILGAIAAACECEKYGNIPVTPEDVFLKLKKIEDNINFKHS